MKAKKKNQEVTSIQRIKEACRKLDKEFEISQPKTKQLQAELNEFFLVVEKTLVNLFKIDQQNNSFSFSDFDETNFKIIYDNLKSASLLVFDSRNITKIVPWDQSSAVFKIRGQHVRSRLLDSGILEKKVGELEREIIDLAKQIQMKHNQIEEEKWAKEQIEQKLKKIKEGEQIIEEKLKKEKENAISQEKMFGEALEALQKDIGDLRYENKKLKESRGIPTTLSSNSLLINSMSQSTIESSNSSESKSRAAINFLKEENARLSGKESKKLLSDLAPISNRNQTIEKLDSAIKEVQSKKILIRKSIVNSLVFDLTKKKSALLIQ